MWIWYLVLVSVASHQVRTVTLADRPGENRVRTVTPADEPGENRVLTVTPADEPGENRVRTVTLADQPGENRVRTVTPADQPGENRVRTVTPVDWRVESVAEDGGRVCPSQVVHNRASSLEVLRGCRVINGHLQIQLFDAAADKQFTNRTFPELREITGYLLLYRVSGLTTLGHLFPNLAVIRGKTLFLNYALIVYNMAAMEDLGLPSLTTILRGAVRIEDNSQLCFLDTVDWSDVTASGSEHIIAHNKAANECRGCADECGSGMCWSEHACVPSERPKCHELCLGGCSGPGPSHCIACRGVRLHGECLSSCPPERLNYLGLYCITKEQCSYMGKKTPGRSGRPTQYWPFDNSCVQQCPRAFVQVRGANDTVVACKACGELCPCAGARIDSIAAAQNLSGCTHVNGSLEIEISGGQHVMRELEDALGSIQVIYGSLKIVRSFPLVTLAFLKSLRVIRGLHSEHSLVVHNNQNLKELWDWKTKNGSLKIQNRRLFFHNNPKLCISKIEKLNKMAGLSNFTTYEVSRESNGDKASCDLVQSGHLFASVAAIKSKSVVVEWKQIKASSQALIRYIVYYIPAPEKNVTTYDERAACGGSDHYWKIKYVNSPANDKGNVRHLLDRLEPYTQYAYYVAVVSSLAYTLRQSDVRYFRTQPDRPSIPRIVRAVSQSHSDVEIQWEASKYPNGIMKYYMVSGTWLGEDEQFLDQRDYCQHPMTLDGVSEDVYLATSRRRKIINCCGEEESSEIKDDRDYEMRCEKTSDVINEMTSEEYDNAIKESCTYYIHTYLSTHLPAQRLKLTNAGKRLGKQYQGFTNAATEEEVLPPWGYIDPSTVSSNENTFNDEMFTRQVGANITTVVVHNVRHFAKYSLKVMGCRHFQASDSATKCSFASIETIRTQPMEGADEIDPADIKINTWNKTEEHVQLHWSNPREPNGMIVSYHIELTREDIGNGKPIVECVTRKTYEQNGGSHIIKNLTPGLYSIRIQAISLAGPGNFSDLLKFRVNETLGHPSRKQIIGATLGTLLTVGCVVALTVYCKSRITSKLRLLTSVNPDYMNGCRYVRDHWELPRGQVHMNKELGQGSFGIVYEGTLGDHSTRCAVKTVNLHSTNKERIEFLNEASVMKSFSDAHHVVRLLGVVSRGHPPLVVMELMTLGDLKSYLREMRDGDNGPDLDRLQMMAAQIADGMAYLEAKKFVHRDLAARNCMLAEDLTVKVGDFGMTRDIYETDYYRNGERGLLPVRWMAPESLADGVFTSQSDMWSYGVVLWEMATLAAQPHQGLANEQVLLLVVGGSVLQRPASCPDALHQLMRACWQWRPDARPNFLQVVQRLDTTADLGPRFQLVSFYHSQEASRVTIYPDTNTQQLEAHWTNTNPLVDHSEPTGNKWDVVVVQRIPPPPRRSNRRKLISRQNDDRNFDIESKKNLL